MNPSTKGDITEAMVLAGLLRSGKVVLQPFGNSQRYDLVIEENGKFLRVQCKTGRLQNGAVVFNTCSVNVESGKAVTRSYHGQIELFGVYCPELDKIYLVPIEDVPIGKMSLRVEFSRKYKTMNDASKYELK